MAMIHFNNLLFSKTALLRLLICISLGILTLQMSGCGVERYEKRLEKTKRYYEYVDKLNRHLLQEPYRTTGISIRLPKQYSEIKNTSKKPEIDLRQPDYFRTLILPGLAGAYEANLPCAIANGKTENKKCYIYLLTNSFLWRNYKPNTGMPDPMKFADNFNQRIGEELNQTSLNITTDSLPPNEEKEFGVQKDYQVCTIIPKEPYNGVSTEFKYYIYKNGDLQTIVLFVTPVSVSGGEKLHIATPLAMHTFEAEKYIFPAIPNKGGSPAPASPAGGAF